MVMDVAAKKNGVSLNDNLLIRPDLLNSLTGVLMRFREQRVTIAASLSTADYVLRKTAEDNREDPAFSQETINAVSKFLHGQLS